MNTSPGPLVITTANAVAVWTINLPHIGNAITDKKFIAEFIAAFECAVGAANCHASVRAVILTGAGKIF